MERESSSKDMEILELRNKLAELEDQRCCDAKRMVLLFTSCRLFPSTHIQQKRQEAELSDVQQHMDALMDDLGTMRAQLKALTTELV
jgi:hypothetical protein